MSWQPILSEILIGLEWVGTNWNELEWIEMGCNDTNTDFNTIGMGWNELEWVAMR